MIPHDTLAIGTPMTPHSIKNKPTDFTEFKCQAKKICIIRIIRRKKFVSLQQKMEIYRLNN